MKTHGDSRIAHYQPWVSEQLPSHEFFVTLELVKLKRRMHPRKLKYPEPGPGLVLLHYKRSFDWNTRWTVFKHSNKKHEVCKNSNNIIVSLTFSISLGAMFYVFKCFKQIKHNTFTCCSIGTSVSVNCLSPDPTQTMMKTSPKAKLACDDG